MSRTEIRAATESPTSTGPAQPPDRATTLLLKIFGRRSKWLVLVVWIALLAGVGPIANKLYEVTSDDALAWLPASAESTVVAAQEDRFPDEGTLLAVAVFARDSGLTDADRAAVSAARDRLQTFAAGGQIADALPSPDGRALALLVPMPVGDDGGVAADRVNELRDEVRAGLPGGLEAKTTGPASAGADIGEAFAGLDATLLSVSVLVVAILLLVTYRSPSLWLMPLLAAGAAIQLANTLVYLLVEQAGLVVNSMNAGILTVLVFGAGTDYALLLIARYREELHRHEDRHVAMAVALRRAGPAVIASAATVAVGLLCLLAADLSSNRGLGPVGAIGVVTALIAMLTLLPVLLLIFGRGLFWPFVPRAGTPPRSGRNLWARIGTVVARRRRLVWVGTALVLAALSFGASGITIGLTGADVYTTRPESVQGQELLAAHFPAGSAEPALITANAAAASAVATAARGVQGVAEVGPPVTSTDGALVKLEAVLTDPPDSAAAEATVQRLRDAVHGVGGADAAVGGSTATTYDTDQANAHDRTVVIPLVLGVVLVILMGLLRALVAPVLLVATVVLSFGTALGLSWLLFEHVFGFNGVDQSLILLGFLFLVALGVDYNIFLITRAREEAAHRGHQAGMLHALAVTGGVITSAGVVLAATFAVLNVLPLVATAELGLLVGLGVLLDTLVVRPILVPALALDVGRKFWWPSRLSRGSTPNPSEPRPADAA
ncbi:MMPL family transporter [Asanoa sp. WMMD1127]|uniref:MMPL family transporter n=1 Tax=Asanoa sp. WMMD1127 TaxID=3016107 RepID=UPI002416A742|nr:MMPL family transporter [Asanoa sp. WMMD1127]MDG4820783.1 MMPL family transporter [Asanoa sp. WMMD1127]